MPRVLLTGVAGFIGHAVAQRLLDAGAEVLGLDSVNQYYDVVLKQARLKQLLDRPGFVFHKLDLADAAATRAAFATFRPEAVVHLAAQAGVRHSIDNPMAYTRANIDGFLSVLEACRAFPVTHLIYASSSSVYGANTKVPFSEQDPVCQPVSLYAATKRANELMAHSYAHLFGIPASALRFFTVYGPWGRPDMAYYKFTKAIFEGRPIDLYNHGRMWRDFTYVDEVVEAIIRLIPLAPGPQGTVCPEPDAEPGRISADVPHRIFNIGNHTPVELERFIKVLEDTIGRKAERRMLPMQPGDVERTFADVEALRRTVGFAPSTSIEAGLAKFVGWYRDYHRPN